MEELTVTAARADKLVHEVPAAVGIVEQDSIQKARQQLSLDESLTLVPGLFMQNRYNFAQDLRIAIRGFGARSSFGIRGIKILVDGIPETLPDGQGQVDSIDLGSTARIEVLRGPSSSLYGNASGGVISVTSEAAPDSPFMEGRLAVGDYDYQKYQLKAAGQSGKFDYLASLSDTEIAGYRDHSEAENTQFSGRLRYEPLENASLTAVLNITDQPVSNDPGGITLEQAQENPRSARDRNMTFDAGEGLKQQRLGFVYRQLFGEHHELMGRNYYVWRDFDNKLPFVGGGAVNLDRFFVGAGFSYAYSASVLKRGNRLIIGFDAEFQDDDRRRFDNDQGVIGILAFDQQEEVNSTGVFVQNEHKLLDNLELTVGARWDRIQYDVADRFLNNGDQSGKVDFNEISPRVGLLYAPRPEINVYGTVSTGFEAPTTTELADPSGSGGFNQNLSAQTATNYEFGVKGWINNRQWYELAFFHIDVEDELIPFEIGSSPGRDFFVNAGASERTGIELGLSSEFMDGLVLSLSYTWSDFTFENFVDENGNDFSGNRLPGIPDNLLNAEARYQHNSGFYSAIDALFVDERFADNANTVAVGSYYVANMRAGYDLQLGSWLIAPFIGINNIFDESYESNIRINAFGGRYFEPAPERNAYAGVSIKYQFRN